MLIKRLEPTATTTSKTGPETRTMLPPTWTFATHQLITWASGSSAPVLSLQRALLTESDWPALGSSRGCQRRPADAPLIVRRAIASAVTLARRREPGGSGGAIAGRNSLQTIGNAVRVLSQEVTATYFSFAVIGSVIRPWSRVAVPPSMHMKSAPSAWFSQ